MCVCVWVCGCGEDERVWKRKTSNSCGPSNNLLGLHVFALGCIFTIRLRLVIWVCSWSLATQRKYFVTLKMKHSSEKVPFICDRCNWPCGWSCDVIPLILTIMIIIDYDNNINRSEASFSAFILAND